MFERNRIDNANSQTHQSAVPAELTMADGEVLVGHFVISAARAFGDVLNGDLPFIEFEPFHRERRYIAKSAIREVKLMDVPGARSLEARRQLPGEFDPYQTLGVRRDADWEEVRQAYLRLAKTYHADRFASVEMPDEVRIYLREMSTRINTAYAALEAPRLQVKKVTLRPEPVYQSRPRA
jgi:hypothetical protein